MPGTTPKCRLVSYIYNLIESDLKIGLPKSRTEYMCFAAAITQCFILNMINLKLFY